MPKTVFIGSYTECGYLQPGTVPGAGVSGVEVDDGGRLTQALGSSKGVRNPSFLAVDGGVLFAVEELTDGAVVALRCEDLSVLSRTATGGSDPCDVLVCGSLLLASNYSSGTVAVIPAQGVRLGPLLQLAAHPGSGPVPGRQESSHAHQSRMTAWNTILVADLGADRVDEYAVVEGDRAAGGNPLVLLASAQLPPGTGPRHMALTGQELLVVGELDGSLHHFHHSDGGWGWVSAVPVYDPARADLSVTDGLQPSHIQLSDDAARLFVAVRGRNSIAVLDVSRIAARQPPVILSEIGCGGDWPRHFLVVEDARKDARAGEDARADAPAATGHGAARHDGASAGRLYVANLRSNRVSVFALDHNGLPTHDAMQQFNVNSPTCVIAGPE
ncbi:MAG TPA: beta-propeller fold lactonase family protein [Micrococcaceae bacterium]